MVGASMYGSSASNAYGRSGRVYALDTAGAATAVANAAPFFKRFRRLSTPPSRDQQFIF